MEGATQNTHRKLTIRQHTKTSFWMLKKYGRSIDTIIAFLGGVKQAKLHEMLLFVRE
jgi:hypothetical protein